MLLSPLRALAAGLLLALAGTSLAQTAPPPETMFALLEEALAELPKERFDYDAALADIGDTSVEAIFAWVRDGTGFLPYRGALKGGVGALMDREGNSLDRALLLEGLLEAAGHSAIVARATLSGAQLEAAVGAVRPAPSADASAADVEALTERAVQQLGVDPQQLKERLEQAAQREARLALELERAAASQGAAIADLVAASPAGAAARTAAETAAAAATAQLLADHWWIQVDVDGAWVDLDPTLPTAAVGQPLAQAELRFDLPEVRFLAAVDGACRDLSCGDRLHRVAITVVAETWDGEQLSEHELATTELLPADGPTRTITFAAQPTNWPADLDLYGIAAPLEVLRGTLLETTEWHPALFVEGAGIGTKRVSSDGEIREGASAGGAAGNAGMLGGGIGGMFGGFGGAASGDTGEETGAFTALWLDYTVHTPGVGARTERREVFDLVGPAARRAGVTALELTDEERLLRATALSGQTEIAIGGAGLDATALQAAAASRLLASRPEWQALYEQAAGLDPELVAGRLADTAALYPPLEVFQVQRAQQLHAPMTGALVAAFHHRFEPDLSVSSSFDLVAGHVTPLPGQGAAFDAQLVQGVLDTALEAQLQATASAAQGVDMGTTIGQAFAADLASGRPWQLVAAADELEGVAPELPADLRARIENDLERGRLALVPTGGAGAVGWWSLDPSTGALLGMGERGWGQATSQYATTTNVVLQVRTAINQYASMGRCLGLALTGPLRGLDSDDADMELRGCIFTTICSGVNTALSSFPAGDNWTNVITLAAIDALWGGVPEADYGGLCGSLWKKISG